MSKADDEQAALRDRLTARLEALRAASRSSRQDRAPVELDQTSVGRLSRMDALQVQAMAQAAESNRSLEIRRTEAAIKRIDDGEYGDCVSCGEEIAAQRLSVDPTIPTCIDCASGRKD